MAFSLPTSWQSNPRTLDQAKTPVYPIPIGKNIYFTEYGDSGISSRNARLSSNVNSAAVMSFVTQQEVFEDTTLREIFIKTLLGGYCASTDKKHTPYQHPMIPGLFAKDFTEVSPLEIQDPPLSAGKVYANYNLCKVTINFETVDYGLGLSYDANGDYNPNFTKINVVSSSNRISIVTGWYRFTGTIIPAAFGAWFVQPTSSIQITMYSVPRAKVFTNPLDIKPQWAQFHGMVNTNAFAGCAAEKLLFDSSEVQPFLDCLGNRLYNVRFNFLYNDWGWNHSISMNGAILPIEYVIGGSKPFSTTLFSPIVKSVNPMTSV